MISDKLTKHDLNDKLVSASIEILEKHKHPVVMNMTDMKEHIRFKKSPFVKNLFYQDKKSNCYLVLANMETTVNKGFWRSIGVNPSNIRLAKEEVLWDVLGVKKG